MVARLKPAGFGDFTSGRGFRQLRRRGNFCWKIYHPLCGLQLILLAINKEIVLKTLFYFVKVNYSDYVSNKNQR